MSALRVGAPVEAGGVTLIPIERVHRRAEPVGAGCWVTGEKEPLAVVVCDAAGARVLGIGGKAWAIDELVHRLPGLRALIDRLTQRSASFRDAGRGATDAPPRGPLD